MGRSAVTFSPIGHGTAVLIAFGLGGTFGLGLGLALCSETYVDWGLYLMLHSFFHMWEYIYVAMFQANELSSNSFLLNHSSIFHIAWAISWSEYFIEKWLFPGMKGSWFMILIGFSVAVTGQGIRTLAMYTAGSNFHHMIRQEKEKNHELITFGIYTYLRHPSYFGWFWWAIATQVLLSNPISIVLYAYASWKFFSDRIQEEESTLVQFFGQDYVNYRSKTPIGIPGIK
eukprot:TRINITY_DN2036_c0_g3_i1.p1 TRINITY_DN2036_c0_g3~~TRINITY_DN2036_c0_g3_i1.p1  ORF type:complete len:229 (-),score=27.15 TRINITY_DN2036_c0_g3_i1:31-717(-)